MNMFETISISASAAAIFSADEGCGLPPPKRKDISGILDWFEKGWLIEMDVRGGDVVWYWDVIEAKSSRARLKCFMELGPPGRRL